jgi:predicted acylesterase/phospholipase RssA
MTVKNIAIACQGGGSHAAFAAGALPVLLPEFRNAGIARTGGKHSPMRDEQGESLLLTGISGTSGGAISALLAWFGFITGGPGDVQARLEGFWTANCAQLPGEQLFNACTLKMAGLSTVDLKFNPYLFPLRDLEEATTRTWPVMASLWPPLREFVRPDYFELRKLFAPYVDFQLIAALGEFCAVPLEVRRWRACKLQSRLFDAAPPRQAQVAKAIDAIEERIRSGLDKARWIKSWIARYKLPDDALLRAAFESWREPRDAVERSAFDTVATAVQEVSYCIPQLLVGAVDVESGAFMAFSSERAPHDAGITLDAVQASASLPWLFEATVIEGTDPDTQEERKRPYWDGLFSQNPPIKNFISGLVDEEKKPDGVWVVQINQDQFDFNKRIVDEHANPVYGNEIWHRRDALSGNLSLNQEIDFIEAVNRRLDDPRHFRRPEDKAIEVARIVLDPVAVGSAALCELDVYSKLDRDPLLKDALWDHGHQQASHFLELRGNADSLCDELANTLNKMGATAGTRHTQLLGWLPGDTVIFGGQIAPDVLTLYRSPDGVHAVAPQAYLRWHIGNASLDGTPVLIQGKTALCADGGRWRLGETHLVKVEQKSASAPCGPSPTELDEFRNGPPLEPLYGAGTPGGLAARPGGTHDGAPPH